MFGKWNIDIVVEGCWLKNDLYVLKQYAQRGEGGGAGRLGVSAGKKRREDRFAFFLFLPPSPSSSYQCV